MAKNYDEELEWINTYFIPQYRQSPHDTYMILIEHAAAELSKTNRFKTLVKSDGTPLDFVFLVQELTKAIQQLNEVTTLALPIPINDERPVDGDLQHQQDLQKRSEKFYRALKESVRDNTTTIHLEINIPDGDIYTLTSCLKELYHDLSKLDAQKIYQYFLIGKVLLAMKNKDKKFMKQAKEVVGYSRQYAYFLIDFYKECVKYPKLAKVSFPIGQIKLYFSYIKHKLGVDKQFWSV